MKFSRFGLVLVVGSMLMTHWETRFFGYHWNPASTAELFADLLCGLVACIGLAFIFADKH